MSSYACTDDPNEVIEKIIDAKADADKLNKFVNGGVYETVQLGSGSPTATLRNTTRLIQSASLVLDGSDVSGKFSTAGNGGQALRMLNDRFGDVVNVKDFGAVGDGVTNDMTAFQAAAATGRCVFVPGGTYKLASNIEGCFYSFEEIPIVGAGSINGSNILRSGFANGNCVPARLSETNPSVNPSRLLAAIEEAHEKGTYVCLPSGTFVFHSPVNLPQGTVGDSGYGYDVHLVGTVNQFILGLNRKYQTGDTTYHVKHFGTVLVYDGTDALFYQKKNFIHFKNISFRNENVSNVNLHTLKQSAMLMKRYDANDTADRTRVLTEGCNFIGWAGCFGDSNIDERLVLYAEWCRFTQNTYSVGNLHDGRVVECSFNGGTNAFKFTGSVISGTSTIANCRIEWTDGDGILITGAQSRNISILGNEFDRCGGCAIKATDGSNISVKSNLMRRSGALQANGSSYHLWFEGVNGLSITGNDTVYGAIQDTGTSESRPNLCYHIDNCENVKMEANDWSGCGDGTQLGTRMSRYFSLNANEVETFVPYGRYGVMTCIFLGGPLKSGMAYYDTADGVGGKVGGGEKFVVLSGVTLPIAEHSYTGELVFSVREGEIQVWNTSSSDSAVQFNIIQNS